MSKMMEENSKTYEAKGIIDYRNEKKHMHQLQMRTREKKSDKDKERRQIRVS